MLVVILLFVIVTVVLARTLCGRKVLPASSHQKDPSGEVICTKVALNEEMEAQASSAAPSVQEVTTIESYMIPNGSHVVFDWDNTLKVVNREQRSIECRVSHEFLRQLSEEKGCELYIVSAIRPSEMNMDTLLIEVDRLGLRCFFCKQNGKTREKGHGDFPWVRDGNIVICGYNKAEVFLTLIKDSSGEDEVDGVNDIDSYVTQRPVVFFDDEEDNIEKFSKVVRGSLCYRIVA